MYSLALDIFDRALSSKPLLSSVEDLVAVLLAKCDFKRRKIDWEDRKCIATYWKRHFIQFVCVADDDEVMDLRVTFEECLQYISEGRFALQHIELLDLTLLCCCNTKSNSFSRFRRPILPH